MEHRWGKRIALKTPVRLITGAGEFMLGQMTDVSISGAFLQTPRPLPLGARVEVEVILRHHHVGRNLERVAAHVTRRASDGAAIEWCDLAPRSVRVLLEAMQAIPRCIDRDTAG